MYCYKTPTITKNEKEREKKLKSGITYFINASWKGNLWSYVRVEFEQKHLESVVVIEEQSFGLIGNSY